MERITLAPCTCTEYQLRHVGCECEHMEQWLTAPKDKVLIWPNGYADVNGRCAFYVLAGTPLDEIEAQARRIFNCFTTVSEIVRHRFEPVAEVSEEDAAHYRKGDNS